MVSGWVGVALATAFVLTTALCAVSLVVHEAGGATGTDTGARRTRRLAAAEANHVVMGVAMILMVAPSTARLVSPTVGVVLFGLMAVAWLGLLVVGGLLGEPLGSIIGCGRCTGHPVHLLALDAAMVVMYLAMLPPPAAMSAMPGMEGMDHGAHASSSPVLTAVGVVLALYLAAHAVATAVVVRRTPEPVPAGGAALPAPVRVAVRGNVQLVGQAGMGLAMAAMLLVGHSG